MKVLSLKQPFAELIVSGKKSIELRNWNTNFRGNFLVHASKIPHKEAMEKFGFERDDLPLGKIVGKVKLVDVKKYKSDKENQKDSNKHLADDAWGKYGFILSYAKRMKPFEAKGKLGFWDFDY